MDLVPGMDTGGEVLGPGLHPLHGDTQLQGSPDDRQLVGVQVELAPEPAAHIGSDDAELGLVQLENVGEPGAQGVRPLAREPHGEMAGGRFRDRQDGARFHR